MEKLPETQIGDTAPFLFGEIHYYAVVYQGKIIGLKAESQISNDTNNHDILKDLMSAAADTVEGKDVQITIKANKQGAYRIIRTVKTKNKNSRIKEN